MITLLQLEMQEVKLSRTTKSSKIVQECGGDSVTIHLREDRRHIRDLDLKIIN